jgi:hypothetical protein
MKSFAILLLVVLTALVGVPISSEAEEVSGRRNITVKRYLAALPKGGAALSVSKELASQRISVIGTLAGSTVERALVSLLSVESDGPVTWVSIAGGRELRGSLKRKQLAESLRAKASKEYLTYLGEEVAWCEGEGLRLWKKASNDERRTLLARLGPVRMLTFLDNEEREALASGLPVPLTYSKCLARDEGGVFLAWLAITSPTVLQQEQAGNGGHTWVLLREKNPIQPERAGLTASLVKPDGFKSVRFSFMRRPTKTAGSRHLLQIGVPLESESGQSPRVTLKLSKKADDQGPTSGYSFEDVLQAVSEATGLTFLSDGYLRPKLYVPRSFEVRDCPLPRVLTRIGDAWNCDWYRLTGESKVYVFRSRTWWSEDAADVPDDVVKDLQSCLAGKSRPSLKDLCRFAELSEAQARKLIDIGACPGAMGLLEHGLYDGVGLQPVFRFLNRLPQVWLNQAQSADGLKLAQVDPLLIQQVLTPTLLAQVGAVRPELRSDLNLRVSEDGDSGYRVRIGSTTRGKCNWVRFVRPAPINPSAFSSYP